MGHFFNPPVGAILGATAGQAYANHKLTPSLETVPNPPFSQRSRTQQIIAINASAAQPSSWPYTYFDNTTGAQPYGPPSPLVQPGSAAPSPHNAFSQSWMPGVVRSWFPDNQPLQQISHLVQPGGPSQPAFNNAWLSQVLQSWQAPDVRTQLPSYLVQPFIPPAPSAYNPYSQGWLPSVVLSWFQPPPAPILPVYSNPANLIVGNPPFGLSPAPIWAYAPGYLPIPVNQQIVSVAPPAIPPGPYTNYGLHSIIRQWFLPDPQPILPKNLDAALLTVGNPPFQHYSKSAWYAEIVVNAWQPPPPQPILPVYSNPANLTMPAPPVQYPGRSAWLASLTAQAWQPPIPAPILPKNLSPSEITTPNPPFQHYSKTAWYAEVIVQSWQPPPPMPTLRTKLPPSALTVPNPPFSERNPLPGILAQWATWPPSLFPTPYKAPPVPTPGPPPVVQPQKYTVSGSDVRVYLTTVLIDVTYRPGSEEKETI
jgi:hypothetical protein